MTGRDDQKPPADGGDDVDGLLESLTGDDPYRDELETIPVDLGSLVGRTEPPPREPEPPTKAKMPLPGGAKLPRPRPADPKAPQPADVKTAQPPAVNPAGPPRREPFPPAASPAPSRAAPIPPPRFGTSRPPPPPRAGRSLAPRPVQRKFQGPAGFDDSEIDAALGPLASGTKPSEPPQSTYRPGPPEPTPQGPQASPSSIPPAADSWNPPELESESLDELSAEELPAVASEPRSEMPATRPAPPAPPATRPAPPATRPAPPATRPAPPAPAGRESMVSVEVSSSDLEPSGVDSLLDLAGEPLDEAREESGPNVQSTFVDWEDESVTSLRAGFDGPASRSVVIEESEASLEELGIHDERPSSLPPSLEVTRPPPPPTDDERPAAQHLGAHSLVDAWVARAEWFEDEAQTATDAGSRSRLFLAASELWAMAGQVARAREAAGRAAHATPSVALATRQTRWLAQLEGDFKAVATALDVEGRTAPSDPLRVHASYLAAEVNRLALSDAQTGERRADLLARAAPADPRAHVAKLSAELGASAAPPKRRLPEEADLAGLASAVATLGDLRGERPDPGSSPILALDAARRAVLAGDREAAGRALGALGEMPGLGDGALLLASMLLAPAEATRGEAVRLLGTLSARSPDPALRRALAARALEQGDREAMARALEDHDDEIPAFGPKDRVALLALGGADPATLPAATEPLGADPDLRPLAAAARAAADPAVTVPLGDPALYALVALGRKLSLAAAPDELKDTVHALRASAPEAALGRVLSLELDRAAGATSAVAAEVSRMAPDDRQADGRLAAALVEEAAGRLDVARRHYGGALGAPRVAEAAGRALLASGEEHARDLLSTLAAALGEETTLRQSLLLFESAVRGPMDDPATVLELLTRAHEACPELPFSSRLATDVARTGGDAEKLLAWIRRQREASRDPIGRALHTVREALLTADDDSPAALVLVTHALEARPDDVALHELAERLDPTPSVERGKWRERIAGQAAEPRTRAFLLYEGALEYARDGAREDATRAAALVREAGGSELAAVAAARLAGETTEPPPEGLERARATEQATLGADRDEELEQVAAELARLPDRGEALAHARLATRLRLVAHSWDATRDLVKGAARHTPRSTWLLRQLAAHARVTADDAELLAVTKELADRVPRKLDIATLCLRAAEAAARLEQKDEALALLARALEAEPEHPVARALRADLIEEADPRVAAGDHELLAAGSVVPEHRFESWYRAAILWLERASDTERGLRALEQAAAIDVRQKDVFDRLQLMYVQRGDRAKLAELLEQRLAHSTDPEERIALEVTRGRALADVGDRDAARRALGSALEANPDHADALEAYADLAHKDGDFASAEETWIKLARVVLDPDSQAAIYAKLAALYDNELPNPARSEICYREILRRRPDDPAATRALVDVYLKQGQTAKAVQLQTELLDKASQPEAKRDLTLGLARVYDSAGDKKTAFTVLDKAKKAWPHDSAVLAALAEHHQRHGETAPLNVLLERAVAEARRALAHGRFEVAFFEMLKTAARARGQEDAAAVVGATLSAMAGDAELELRGGGAAAASPDLDDLLAPELFGAAFRALLARLPGVLDLAYPVDLKALKATPLPVGSAELGAEMRIVAESFGIRTLEILVSPALGPVVLAASSAPARIVVGQPLLDSDDHAARYFCLVRALKMLQAHVAAFPRIPPIELGPAAAALLSSVAKGFTPQGIDANKLADARRRIEAALPAKRDEDLATLALEVGGAIGNRASQLGQAATQWGSRTGLLAVGSPVIAFRGIALSQGQTDGPPKDAAERLKWVQRQPDSKDLTVWSVSEAYAEARRRIGLGEP